MELKQMLKSNFNIDDWTLNELIEWIEQYSYECLVEGDLIKQIDLQDHYADILNFDPIEFISYWEYILRLKYENLNGCEEESYINNLKLLVNNLQKLI